MNRVVRLSVLAALILSLVTFGVAGAQTGVTGLDAAVTYTSGFQVQNLESTDAAVSLEFYNQDGTLAVTPAPTYTVAGNGSKTFFPINDVSTGFNGSLVISSDKDIRAVSNLVGSGPGNYFAATNGFQAGSATVSLPLVMCNNSGFDTFFNVQNAGSADANYHHQLRPGQQRHCPQRDRCDQARRSQDLQPDHWQRNRELQHLGRWLRQVHWLGEYHQQPAGRCCRHAAQHG